MKKLLLLMLCFCSASLVMAQEQTVTGKVTSASDAEVLPGVNVIVSGTTKGTTTDFNGEFSINVPGNASLVFSFIGYKTTEVPVNGRSVLNITLEDDIAQLDEVVITGYGSIRKKDLTSAHTTVGAEEIQKTVNTTIEQAIQGRAAGVYVTQNSGQPGGGMSINIRGVSSINGNTQPLYVIDGVQIEGSQVSGGAQSSSNPLSGLNPADIASMEILQGPSATALYGSRATNGVVVITTKRGKAGDIRISYGFQYSLQTEPQKLDVMNLRQYAQMVNEYKEIDGGDTPTEFLDPSILGEGTDWQDELFNRAAMNKHQLSLSGGSDKTRYYFSGEYLNQEGIAIGSGFERYSTRVNLDNDANDWLSIGVNLSFNQTHEQLTTSQENIISNALRLSPHIPVKNFDGSFAGGDVSENPAEQFIPPNPIGLATITTNDLTKRQLLGGVNLSFKIMDGLTFRTSLNSNWESKQSTYFVPEYEFGYQRNDNATLSNNSTTSTYWNWNQMLQYEKKVGSHNFNIMASHEAQRSHWESVTAGISDFVVDGIIDLNLGNSDTETNAGGKGSWAMESFLGRVNYNFKDRYLLMAAIRADGSSNFGRENKWGYFPSFSVAWRVSEEPFFDVDFINDFRLRFENGLTGNQGGGGYIYGQLGANNTPWGTGFSVSRYSNPALKWEETNTNNFGLDMAFFENRIQFEVDYYIKKTDNLLTPAANPWYMGVAGTGSIANPQVNLGSLENKGWTISLNTINLDRDGFTWQSNFNVSRVNTKITSLSTESGYYARTSWWLDDWTQRAAVGEAPWLFYGYVADGIFQSVEEIENSPTPTDNNGNKLPVAENGIWVGDVKYKDISGPDGVPDGVINTYDQTYIGNPWPKLFAGLTNTFSYKDFSLSILLTGVFGNDIYNYVARTNTNPNNINLSRNLLVDVLDYAKIETNEEGDPYLSNPNTDIARIYSSDPNGNYDRHTTKYVEDGSYIKIKNISLTYNVPASIIGKQKVIRGARITFSGQNIATFTKYSGYDPEVGAYVGRDVDASNQAIGLDNGRYPLTPVYSMSLGIDF
ncbi:SusC/RagA family TonB-linked outer membrane protein [Fulvivirga ligni]|uniref:SusC/RagA family TonB-linked outer membrane protein n=1 Tax=Fulvivirga ligni TaxID=2904246 RepID=UPI001F3E91FD|nr:TonB-dependent receptor [Fulvivirga ligni]UII23701.1 TonB-dependent receptor [Fulvivirga ligni]